MITLYVLTCDNLECHHPKRAIESFGDIVDSAYILDHRDLMKEISLRVMPSNWYGYIFSDEMIEEEVRDALPIFLREKRFDSLILMKKDGEKITQAPRIFHKTVKLKQDTFLPEFPERCVFERLLDGWILPNANYQIN